jgi:large conductance mechanosensitive channel
MLKEFREFAIRGNVVDMAVGIIIGGAFGTIVQSLVNDIIMPPIGLLIGGVDFQDVFLVLKEGTSAGPYPTLEAAQAAGAVTVNVGLFFNAVLSFLIVAWAVFMLVRGMNRLRRDQDQGGDTPSPTTRTCPYCKRDMAIGATRCPHCTSEVEPA